MRGGELVDTHNSEPMGGKMHYFKHKLHSPLKHKNLNDISPYYIDTLRVAYSCFSWVHILSSLWSKTADESQLTRAEIDEDLLGE
jgi:hypothetical protein